MQTADYFRALLVVLAGGILVCLLTELVLVMFYGARRATRKENPK